MGVVLVMRHLKLELAWSTDKRLQVISNIMLFKTEQFNYIELLWSIMHHIEQILCIVQKLQEKVDILISKKLVLR